MNLPAVTEKAMEEASMKEVAKAAEAEAGAKAGANLHVAWHSTCKIRS